MIEYAIFDMDGTLLDSMPFWKDLSRNYLLSKGYTVPADLDDHMATTTMEGGAQYLKTVCGITDDVETMVYDIKMVMKDAYMTQIPAKSGAKELLAELHAQGVQMCVATSSSSKLAQAVLARVGLLEYFTFFVDCTTLGTTKESAEIYEYCAQKLGGTRHNTVVFEDATHAIRTVHQAGFPLIAIADEEARSDAPEIRRLANLYVQDYHTLTAQMVQDLT